MKSLQEYIEIYRSIARNLNLQGDSVEMLAQMLANATFISEVEHISYSQEASLERATLMNSKIQHCMNDMYSVFRGSCPRVVIRFKSNSYYQWNVFDEIATSNNFNVYYLGHLIENMDDIAADELNLGGTEAIATNNLFSYSPVVIPPTGDDKEYTIIALISPKCLKASWTLSKENLYYVDFLESDLSNDLMVKVNDEFHPVSRVFADHIKDASIFDLTIPDFGLRLYAPDIFRKEFSDEITETPANTKISLDVFRYSTLDSYSPSELKQIKIKGAKLVSFEESFLRGNSLPSELTDGLVFLEEISRDSLNTIHYRANRERYMGSMLRSNSDIGVILEEMYPEKVRKSGTAFMFESLKTTKEETTLISHLFRDFPNPPREIREFVEIPKTNTEDLSISIYASKETPVRITEEDYISSEVAPETHYTRAIDLSNLGQFENDSPRAGIIKLPIEGSSGTLRLLHKNYYDLKTSAVYTLVPSISVIQKKYNHETDKWEPMAKGIEFSVIRTSFGITDVISTYSELSKNKLGIRITTSDKVLAQVTNQALFFPLNPPDVVNITAILYRLDGSNEVLDAEDIPTVYIYNEEENQGTTSSGESKSTSTTTTIIDKTVPNQERTRTETTTTTSNTGDTSSDSSKPQEIEQLILSLSEDVIHLETLATGEVVSKFPFYVTAAVYYGGKLLSPSEDSVVFSVVNSSTIKCEISNEGLLTISSVTEDFVGGSIVVKATYKGIGLSQAVTIESPLSEDAFKTRTIVVSDDPTGKTYLTKFTTTQVGQLSEFFYENPGGIDNLYLWCSDLPGVKIYSLEWEQEKREIVNVLPPNNEGIITPKLVVYYIPQTPASLLTEEEIEDYVKEKSSYYVTNDIEVRRGKLVNVLFDINVELFQNSTIDSYIGDILENYENTFNVNLSDKYQEIISSISKISNIKSVKSMSMTFTNEVGDKINSWDDIVGDLKKTYFSINYQINSIISNQRHN